MYIDIEVDNSIPLDYDNYADTDWIPPNGMVGEHYSLARSRQKNR